MQKESCENCKESNGHMGGIKYEHPSMAMVGLSRQQSSEGISLFGSDVKHRHLICLTVKSASVERELSSDWFHGNDTLIELYLSPTQFADMLTTMNVGDGVPATLCQFNKTFYEQPVLPSKADQFKSEIKADVQKVTDNLMKAYCSVEECLADDKPLGKKGKQELLTLIKTLKSLADNHLPFVMEQYQKCMSKITSECKSEVDAFVEHTAIKFGLDSMKNEVPLIRERTDE